MPTFGLIVEGDYDAAALREWIRKAVGDDAPVIPRLCAQKGSLMKKFPGYLAGFRRDNYGGPVDKALVIRDADGKDPQALMATMRARASDRVPAFPVEFVIIVQELETWLLADNYAIAQITEMNVPAIQGTLEELRDPKQRLQTILFQAGMVYTAEVARKIAAASDPELIAYRCPSFRTFRQAIFAR